MTGEFEAEDAEKVVARYCTTLSEVATSTAWRADVVGLARLLWDCWENSRQVFICGNGGSAGNAAHLANDFLYGVSKTYGEGLRVNALSCNASVLTCLANDKGYEEIFSHQVAVLGETGDVLIVLSGSGNSPNILRALEAAREKGMTSVAVVGFSGGTAKTLADISIHFEIDDMQISEDMQLVVGHMVMQFLYANKRQY